MATIAVVEICYTDSDVTTAEANWTKRGFKKSFTSTSTYVDIAVYERKNGEQAQLTEKYGGKQPTLLVFEK